MQYDPDGNTIFDDAFNDPYFTLDTCNMIHTDSTTKAEVPDDTVSYAVPANIVDTVRADNEHLDHFPLLQVKKMIQDNLILPHGSSEKAQLLSTYNQIKATITREFFCPNYAIVKNVPQPPEFFLERQCMGD